MKNHRRVTISVLVLLSLMLSGFSMLRIVPTASASGSPWASAATYPVQAQDTPGVAGQSCVNGTVYIYCVGGQDVAEGPHNAVYTSSAISPYYSNITGWTPDSALYPQTIYAQSCVAYSGDVYCVGGTYDDAGDDVASSYYAPLSNGVVGAWSPTTPYPTPVDSQSCVESSGYIYCVGGYGETEGTNATAYLSSSVEYASLSSSGIGPWQNSTSYPLNSYGPACFAGGGYVYCVGGFDNNNNPLSTSYYAPLSATGVGTWTQTTAYPFQGLGQACAISLGYVYCVGGDESSGLTNVVYYATVSSGGIGAWGEGPSYPESVLTTCAISTGDLYCIGGFDGSSAGETGATYYAPLSLLLSATTTSTTTTGTTPSVLYARINTSLGSFEIELFASLTPQTVANFVSLVNQGFYNDLVWHRIQPGFVIQTGDPTTRNGGGNRSTWGEGGSGVYVPFEYAPSLHNDEYYLGMASTGAGVGGSSQFYINLANNTSLDGSYAVFGKVISGYSVVQMLGSVPVEQVGGQDEPVTPVYVTSIVMINSSQIATTTTTTTTCTLGPYCVGSTTSTTSTGSLTPTASQTIVPASAPSYAFNGAYATYQTTLYGRGSLAPTHATVTYKVTDVDDAAQSFYVNITSSGDFPPQCNPSGTGGSATFANPSPFFALNATYTMMLNQGVLPPGTSQATDTPNIVLSVPAGTFKTDEISEPGASLWIDASNGIVVKESTSSSESGSCYGTLVLASTNIPLGTSSSSLLTYVMVIVVVAAVVAAVFISLLIRRRGSSKPSQASESAPVGTSANCSKCGAGLSGTERSAGAAE
jgi:cyclophilin family peptidyl-prolyl cis-trans isomerase